MPIWQLHHSSETITKCNLSTGAFKSTTTSMMSHKHKPRVLNLVGRRFLASQTDVKTKSKTNHENCFLFSMKDVGAKEGLKKPSIHVSTCKCGLERLSDIVFCHGF